ncbi:hypothetical protein [Bacillus cereus]|uniref:hypothetical protein n=1 Tax=Bacillus cereus TaxID=1396 RepID=UPI00159704E4|nr:hypothetical protein [Bacillus cereus]
MGSQILLYQFLRVWLIYLYLKLIECNSKPVQKGSTIKKKNKKEQDKKNKDNIDNYQGTITKSLESTQFKSLMINEANEFYTQFTVGRWNEKQWNRLIEKFAEETIENGSYKNIPEDKIRGYVYKSLENICDHSDYKRSEEFSAYQEVIGEFSSSGINENKLSSGLHKRIEFNNNELPY